MKKRVYNGSKSRADDNSIMPRPRTPYIMGRVGGGSPITAGGFSIRTLLVIEQIKIIKKYLPKV